MEIDEISHTLGVVQNTLDNHEKAHTLILSKLDKIDDKLSLTMHTVDKAHSRIDAANEQAITKKDALKVVLTLGIFGGASGVGLSKALATLFGFQ